MEFRKYADGKYRATAIINDENGDEVEALFTTPDHPSEVSGWEKSNVTTANGNPVFVPRPESITVDVEKISATKQSDLKGEKLEVDWLK